MLVEIEKSIFVRKYCCLPPICMKDYLNHDLGIIAGKNALDHLPPLLEKRGYSGIYVLVDENTEQHCLPLLRPFPDKFITIRVHSGEQHKTPDTLQWVWEHLLSTHAERDALLI